ncbi:hypothetical protein [Methylobacterium currus]|uniref:hypothetical protein n=1 Tax=Methylobacterium currus TaxID=2051553 RepID=UPI0022AAC440|nr:hypothetical protein [Methylobacterium currus]
MKRRGFLAQFAAPLWRFKERLGATEDPEASREATGGHYLMEVFPALAMPSLDPAVDGRLGGPRDNPAHPTSLTPTGWQAVIATVRQQAVEAEVAGSRSGRRPWRGSSPAQGRPGPARRGALRPDRAALARPAAGRLGHDRRSRLGRQGAPASRTVRARLEAVAKKAVAKKAAAKKAAAKACAVPADPERRVTTSASGGP